MEQEVLLQHEASLFGRQTHRALCGLKGKLRLDSSARMNRTNRGKRSRALHCASLQTAAINLHYPPPTLAADVMKAPVHSYRPAKYHVLYFSLFAPREYI